MTTCITIKTESVTVQNVKSVTATEHVGFSVLTFTDRDGATTKVFFDGIDAPAAEAMARAYALATQPAPEPQTLDVLLADEVAL